MKTTSPSIALMVVLAACGSSKSGNPGRDGSADSLGIEGKVDSAGPGDTTRSDGALAPADGPAKQRPDAPIDAGADSRIINRDSSVADAARPETNKPCSAACAAGLVCDTTRGLCVQCLVNGDCTGGQACNAGYCVNRDCLPNLSRCADLTTVLTCNADGTSEMPFACSKNSYCVASASSASCKDAKCKPGELTCGLYVNNDYKVNMVAVCSPDGQGTTLQEDCTAKGQGCFNAACAPIICTPSARRCTNGNVEICDSSGAGWKPLQACNANELCSETPTAACRTKPCTPNQVGCSGNAVATCNATGTGFVGAETDCGDQICMAGACLTRTFFEPFDDLTTAPWDKQSQYTTTKVVSAGALKYFSMRANGSLRMYFDSFYHSFPTPMKPGVVSVWIRGSGTYAWPWVVLSDGAYKVPRDTQVSPEKNPYQISLNANSQELHVWSAGTDGALVNSSTQNFLTSTWLHVRLVFDWTARTVTPYWSQRGRDDVETPPLAGAPLPLAPEMTSIARIDLFDHLLGDNVGSSDFDSIEFFE
jgi:hypothetical protein